METLITRTDELITRSNSVMRQIARNRKVSSSDKQCLALDCVAMLRELVINHNVVLNSCTCDELLNILKKD